MNRGLVSNDVSETQVAENRGTPASSDVPTRVLEFPTSKDNIISLIEHSRQNDRVKMELVDFLNSDKGTSADLDDLLVGVTDPLLIQKIRTYFEVEKVLRRELVNRDEELAVASENALFDALTGLENRRSFDEGMLSAVNRAYRVGSKIFLVMIDVDLFKKVNDDYGHSAGDYVLKEFGKILKTDNLLRKSEKPFRYGGEEFAILVDGDPNDSSANEKVVKLCERIRRNVEQHEFIFDGKKIPVTISLGVAGFDQVKVSDEEIKRIKETNRAELAVLDDKGRKELIELADSALYAAKGKNGNGGRNRTVLADGEKDPVYKQFLLDQITARG